ncbi:MAG: hypothetical protein QOE61_359 [Micromonosporaceae bacterium]|jgi:hypothetical protein|nr:hypothetical protein [Micromonosporaceae bacterium]
MAATWARGLVGMAAVASLLALGACGGGDGAGTPAGPAVDGGDSASLGPTLTVTLDVTGETSIKGSSTSSAPSNNGISPKNCADYAKGSTKDNGKTYYVMPSLLGSDVDGKKVLVAALVSNYTGPGSYGLGSISGQGTAGGIEVGDRPYVIQPQITKGELVTDAKGGATWTFTRLAFSDGSGKTSPGINGKISWTCKD